MPEIRDYQCASPSHDIAVNALDRSNPNAMGLDVDQNDDVGTPALVLGRSAEMPARSGTIARLASLHQCRRMARD